MGPLEGSHEITATDVHVAEMQAILHAVRAANEKYPNLIGFFINSDNKHCCEAFWDFRKGNIFHIIVPIKEEVLKIVGTRWIRAKHVKAHTKGQDTRSYMNRQVDRMTRTRTEPIQPLTKPIITPVK